MPKEHNCYWVNKSHICWMVRKLYVNGWINDVTPYGVRRRAKSSLDQEAVEQAVQLLVVWEAMTLMWYQSNSDHKTSNKVPPTNFFTL